MNSNWLWLVLAVVALVIVPRFIVELAWGRRVRLRAEARGISQLGVVDRLRAQTIPWIVFGVVGIALAVIALVVVAFHR